MNFDINVTAGLVAGLAAMVPGSIIYNPGTPTGRAWMKAATTKSTYSVMQAMSMMLLVSLLTGLVASVVVSTAGAKTVMEAVELSLLLSFLPISVNLSQSFFEGRAWALANVGILNQILTFAAIGVVLGLFL